eukprot:793340-Amphidinium_carterae.1
MALVGNHFQQPAGFPPCIYELERGSIFCVSTKTFVVLSRNFALSASALVLCYLWSSFRQNERDVRVVATNRHYFRAKSAWQRTIYVHTLLVLGAFLLLASYSSASTVACFVPLQRLHFPFLSHEKHVQRTLEVRKYGIPPSATNPSHHQCNPVSNV